MSGECPASIGPTVKGLAGNPNIKKKLIPVGRFGEPDEVADVAVLLASNGYMTGQTINVNGGWYVS